MQSLRRLQDQLPAAALGPGSHLELAPAAGPEAAHRLRCNRLCTAVKLPLIGVIYIRAGSSTRMHAQPGQRYNAVQCGSGQLQTAEAA